MCEACVYNDWTIERSSLSLGESSSTIFVVNLTLHNEYCRLTIKAVEVLL